MAGGMAAMLLCTLFFSCNNEDFLENGNPEKACDNICFGISPDKNVRTRGGNNGKEKEYTSDRFVLRSQDSEDTLCVRAIVSDGINVSGFEGEQALTRGVPVGKDNFYDKFHVLAYWKKSGTPVDQFYMDTNASNAAASVGAGAIWNTEQIYYWPGADHSFQFYAWAPTDAGGLTTPSAPTSKELTYTVPEAVADQKDLVVATTEEIQGNNNAAVPLTFQHICTAVRFAVGNEMQSGTIKSVALKGVYNSGTFDMETSVWTLNETTANYTQTLNKSMDGNETNGSEITPLESTFMMLPQTLPAGTIVEVVFDDGITGHDRVLNTSIASSEWRMGTTVTYKLSVTPEYDLEFVSEPVVQDAHYVIYPITIHIGETNPNRSCLVHSTNPAVTIQDAKHLNDFDRQGYWIEADRGSETVEVSGVSGDFTIYAYVEENVTDAPRDFTIELYPQPATLGKPVDTFTFTQLCPSWNGNLGCERIEDKDYPWGFLWSSDMKVTYNVKDALTGLGGLLQKIWIAFYVGLINNDEFVTQDFGTLFAPKHDVIFDFSKVPSPNVAKDENDGQTNTQELYNFGGVSAATDLMDYIESFGVKPDKELPSNPSDFAARACVMKNRYKIIEVVDKGQTVKKAEPISYDWYLPSMNEAPQMQDTQYPLTGAYWTSTAAATEDEDSYKYTIGGLAELEKRDVSLHVRAVRRRP